MGDLAERVARLEELVAELLREHRPSGDGDPHDSEPAGDGPSSPADTPRPQDTFWVLDGLERRQPDSVVFAGSVEVADGPVRWQQGLTGQAVLAMDWSELAGSFDALGHPVRLQILQLIMSGVHGTGELLTQEGLGTTGQLHHHLRQLVSAGWLTSTRRGQYAVPGPRIVPLLIMMTAALR